VGYRKVTETDLMNLFGGRPIDNVTINLELVTDKMADIIVTDDRETASYIVDSSYDRNTN
jgi:hypothetical protein